MKLNLGKTPEQQKAEEAKKQRELEAEIQKSIMERQKKIVALHKKQKSNKIIIFSISAVITIALLVFGTYNTFFKQGLTMDEVSGQINKSTNTLYFPTEGVTDYIVNNSQTLFDKYIRLDPGYEYAKVDKNSIYIDKLNVKNSSFAIVYFSMDVQVKEMDKEVTDPEILKQLQRNGFGTPVENTTPVQETQPIQSAEPQPTEPSEPEPEVQPNEQEVLETENPDAPIEEQPTEESTEEVVTEEVTTEEITTEEVTTEAQIDETNTPTSTMDMANGKGQEVVEYYMLAGGTIMQKGVITTTRYEFCLPLELYSDTEKKISFYRPCGEMTIYSLIDPHQNTFDKIEESSAFAFPKDTKIDEEESNPAKIKVDKTLSDLYNKRDTSQDFLNVRQFNTYDATYISLDKFELYNTTNQLGYNAKATYTIKTQQGFYYSINTYIFIEKSGTSWVIKKIM